jgi:hypothetical protein
MDKKNSSWQIWASALGTSATGSHMLEIPSFCWAWISLESCWNFFFGIVDGLSNMIVNTAKYSLSQKWLG